MFKFFGQTLEMESTYFFTPTYHEKYFKGQNLSGNKQTTVAIKQINIIVYSFLFFLVWGKTLKTEVFQRDRERKKNNQDRREQNGICGIFLFPVIPPSTPSCVFRSDNSCVHRKNSGKKGNKGKIIIAYFHTPCAKYLATNGQHYSCNCRRLACRVLFSCRLMRLRSSLQSCSSDFYMNAKNRSQGQRLFSGQMIFLRKILLKFLAINIFNHTWARKKDLRRFVVNLDFNCLILDNRWTL